MIDFAAFALKKEKEVSSPIPVAHITHGSHANRPKIPDVYIQHGKHSKQQIFEEYAGFAGEINEWFKKPSNEHLGANKAEKDQFLEHHQSDMFDDINDKERGTVKTYTDYSYDINTSLHDNGGHEKLDDNNKETVKHLDTAIKKHKLPKMTTYSGIGFNPETVMGSSKGIIKSSAFTSSSTDKGTAHGFAQGVLDDNRNRHYHVLKINVPDNQKGIYIGNAGGPRGFTSSSEHEVLLPRDTHYKITGRKVYGYGHNRTHVWNAHIIPEGENPHTWEPK